MSEARLQDLSMAELTKLYRPTTPIWRRQWILLHIEHCKALLRNDWFAAAKIADQKYAIYLRSKGLS